MSTIFKQAVGIDMAKDKFDVCFSVMDTQQRIKVLSTRKFANSAIGLKEFDLWVKKWATASIPLAFVVEATGVYHEQLAWHLYQQQASLAVILPNKAKKYFQSLGLKSKTDKIDAKGLAQLAAQQSLEPWQPLSADLYQLRTLTREQESLHQLKTMLSNQLHALAYARLESKATIERLQQHLSLIQEQTEQIKKQVTYIVEQNQELKERVDKIVKIKGLGLMSVITVLAECNGFALISNHKQLVSYAGYDVVANDSGTRTGKTRISKKGNSHIRRILHMPSLNMVRYQEPHFLALYQRMIAKGKTKMQAYVAIQRKLLILIYSLWMSGEEYNREAKKIVSGEQEPKLLFSQAPKGAKKAVASAKAEATQDELLYEQSPEALFSQDQR